MKTVGIIAEYNPFHNGHKYHIEESKRITGATHTVVVMSGDFVMRGEPACFNKLIRAEAAVKCGADLVIELPLCFSLSSAEHFAYGGISILDSLNGIDYLSFGSECGDINILCKIAGRLSSDKAVEEIKCNMKKGVPVYEAISEIMPEYADIIKEPNNILAINYLKALSFIKSSIEPVTVKRKNAPYNSAEANGEFASALAIRTRLEEGKTVEEWIPSDLYDFNDYVSEKSFDSAITYALRKASKEDIINVRDVGEGLENLIYEASHKKFGAEEIAKEIKSKRYTYTRIKRIIYNLFLGIDKALCDNPPGYARVLAFNDKGREIIKELKGKSRIPIITNITEKTFLEYPQMKEELRAAHIYSIGEKGRTSRGELICKYIGGE